MVLTVAAINELAQIALQLAVWTGSSENWRSDVVLEWNGSALAG